MPPERLAVVDGPGAGGGSTSPTPAGEPLLTDHRDPGLSPRGQELLNSLKRGTEPGCFGCTPCGSSPFLEAVEQGRVEDIDAVLGHNVTHLRERVGTSRRNAWHIAAAKGDVSVLKVLAQHVRDNRTSLASISSSMRRTALGHATFSLRRGAVSSQDDEVLRGFLDSITSRGYTPLICAALGDHAPAVELLLSWGADAWRGDELGMNALHHAARAGSINALHMLLQHVQPVPVRPPPPNTATAVYVNVLDYWGCTPLHHAVWNAQRTAVAALVGYDANLIARSIRPSPEWPNMPPGVTPLHLAAARGNLDMVKQLLRAYYEQSADLVPSQTALMGTIERRRRQRSHPDPRLILTRTQRLAFHVAASLRHRPLLDWLDPSIPLMFLFGGDDTTAGGPGNSGPGPVVGVPRLTVIAAKALHASLSAALSDAKRQIAEHEAEKEAAAAAPPLPPHLAHLENVPTNSLGNSLRRLFGAPPVGGHHQAGAGPSSSSSVAGAAGKAGGKAKSGKGQKKKKGGKYSKQRSGGASSVASSSEAVSSSAGGADVDAFVMEGGEEDGRHHGRGGGGGGHNMSSSIMRRLYRLTLERGGRNASVTGLVNRAVVLPTGPDEHVAYFRYNAHSEPNYPMPSSMVTSPARPPATRPRLSIGSGSGLRPSQDGHALNNTPGGGSESGAAAPSGGLYLTNLLRRNSTDSGSVAGDDGPPTGALMQRHMLSTGSESGAADANHLLGPGPEHAGPSASASSSSAVAGGRLAPLAPPQARYPSGLNLMGAGGGRLPPLGSVPEEAGGTGTRSMGRNTSGGGAVSGTNTPPRAQQQLQSGGGAGSGPQPLDLGAAAAAAAVARVSLSGGISGPDPGVLLPATPQTPKTTPTGGLPPLLPGAAEPTTPDAAARWAPAPGPLLHADANSNASAGGAGPSGPAGGIAGAGTAADSEPAVSSSLTFPTGLGVVVSNPTSAEDPRRRSSGGGSNGSGGSTGQGTLTNNAANNMMSPGPPEVPQPSPIGGAAEIEQAAESWLTASGRFASDMLASLRNKLSLRGGNKNQVVPLPSASASPQTSVSGMAGGSGAAGSSRLMRVASAGAGAGAVPRGKGKARVAPMMAPMFGRGRTRAATNRRGKSARHSDDGRTSSEDCDAVNASDQDVDKLKAAAAAGSSDSKDAASAVAQPQPQPQRADADDADDEDACPVCLEDCPNLRVNKCRHALCSDCAGDLLKRNVLTPALCPYCRGIIRGFIPILR